MILKSIIESIFYNWKSKILQGLFEMYLQSIPNNRNISWSSFDLFSVYDNMLPYSWSTEAKYHFISKVVLALTLLIKSIFSILAITSNFSQRETTIALKVLFMVLLYYRTLSNACRIMLFNLQHEWCIYDLTNY